jgi:hypothetical protein
MGRSYRYYRRRGGYRPRGEPRYSDFYELVARRDSGGCVNGADHRIKAGDVIGWSRAHRLACCAECWSRWVAENREADAIEAGYVPCPF